MSDLPSSSLWEIGGYAYFLFLLYAFKRRSSILLFFSWSAVFVPVAGVFFLMMSDFKVFSYNVRGLSSPFKWSRVRREVHALKPQVLMLQETHLQSCSIPKLPFYLFDRWFQSMPPIKRTKDVAIAFHKTCPFIPEALLANLQGIYVMVKGTLDGNPITFFPFMLRTLARLLF